MSNEKKFRSLSLTGRFRHLKKEGKYLDSRFFGSYQVHLYEVEGFFAEVWVRLDFEEVVWIEIASSEQVAENYAGNIDLNDSLGL